MIMSTISSFDDALDFYPESKGDHAAGSLTAKLPRVVDGHVRWPMQPPIATASRHAAGRRTQPLRRCSPSSTGTEGRASKHKGGSLAAPACGIEHPAKSGCPHALGGIQPAFDLFDIGRIAVAKQALPGRVDAGVGQHVGAKLVGIGWPRIAWPLMYPAPDQELGMGAAQTRHRADQLRLILPGSDGFRSDATGIHQHRKCRRLQL